MGLKDFFDCLFFSLLGIASLPLFFIFFIFNLFLILVRRPDTLPWKEPLTAVYEMIVGVWRFNIAFYKRKKRRIYRNYDYRRFFTEHIFSENKWN